MNVVLKRYGWFLVKLLVFGLTAFYLFQAVSENRSTYKNWRALLQSQGNANTWFWLGFSAVLILFNWGVEAWKWWLLAAKIERISFWKAYRSVMVGLTLGFITPNRVGDYAGRILDLNSPNRNEAFGSIFLGRFAQLIITIVFGSLGSYYFLWLFYWQAFPWAKLSLGLLLLTLNGAILLLYFHAKLILALVMAIKPLRRFLLYIRILARYSVKELAAVLLLAGLRYVIFCLQFGFLLFAFGVKLSFLQYASGISGTFLFKSVVPSLSALTDIGMREISAMHFFRLFGQDALPVISASICLWFLNIVIPSAIGLLFVFQLKLRKAKKL